MKATTEYYEARITELDAMNTRLNEQLVAQADYVAYESRIAQLLQELENTQARLLRYTDSFNTASTDKVNLIEAIKNWTLENLSDGTIDEYVAEAIAIIMGFELTQEFEATVTVEYYITINARDEESAREVVNEMDFETVQLNDDSITYLSANVEHTYF